MSRPLPSGSVVVFALVIATLVLSVPTSADTTILWTTASDFDGGTKSQPSPVDGNYQVETNTDNPGITTNQLELASIKGDRFTLADADAVL